MEAVEVLTPEVGTRPACVAMGIPPATVYRHRARRNGPLPPSRRWLSPGRALASQERQEVLDVLHSEEFMDKAPQEVYAALLDQGRYLCSVRTMYRLLEANHEVRERRDQLRHPSYAKPELLATGPNQVFTSSTGIRFPMFSRARVQPMPRLASAAVLRISVATTGIVSAATDSMAGPSG